MPLEKELKFYQAHKEEFLKHYKGKFVLIKDNELVGVFDNDETAFNTGVDKFGVASFLIKQVLKDEEIQKIPALTLGLIHANP